MQVWGKCCTRRVPPPKVPSRQEEVETNRSEAINSPSVWQKSKDISRFCPPMAKQLYLSTYQAQKQLVQTHPHKIYIRQPSSIKHSKHSNIPSQPTQPSMLLQSNASQKIGCNTNHVGKEDSEFKPTGGVPLPSTKVGRCWTLSSVATRATD